MVTVHINLGNKKRTRLIRKVGFEFNSLPLVNRSKKLLMFNIKFDRIKVVKMCEKREKEKKVKPIIKNLNLEPEPL